MDFLGPFLSCLKRRIERGSHILLHPRQDVAVKVKRNPRLGMSQPFAGNLGVDSRMTAYALRERAGGREIGHEEGPSR